MKPATTDLSTNFFLFYFCINCLTSKFVIIGCSKIFRFNVYYFCIIICFLTRLQTSGILFSTAANTKVVAKPEILSIFLCFSDFRIIVCFLKQIHWYQWHLLLQLMYHIQFFWQLLYLLYCLQEQLLICLQIFYLLQYYFS